MEVAQPNATLQYTVEDNDCNFRLIDSAGRAIAVSNWTTFETASNFAVFAILAGFVQSEIARVNDTEDTVSLSAADVAKLDDETSAALGLPSPVPYLLQIDARGRLGNLRLDTRWINSDGLRIRDASASGPFLLVGSVAFRLVSPFYDALKQIDAFNARGDGPPAQQARDWADIQELIGLEPAHIHPSQFLERMRVARANRFSLDFVADEDGQFQVAPVPLAAQFSATQGIEGPSQSEVDGSVLPEPRRLLSSGEQERFQRSFRARSEVQGQYLGGNDVYVLLSPEVKRSLEVVRRIQDAPPAERLAFARNPFMYLKEPDSESEPPFCESRCFSDRVTGLGRLEKITLPWQILGSQGWLPPQTIRINLGSTIAEIAPSSLDAAIVDVELAVARGEQTALVDGIAVSASLGTRDALLGARADLDARAAVETTPRAVSEGKSPSPERVGLQVTRNLEDAKYVARHAERSKVSFDLPEIDTELKVHQVEAIRWLQQRWANGKRGALLADDMGLGKSLSALAFMVWLRGAMQNHRVPARPMLIVAPVSLLETWQLEHKRHIGANPCAFTDIVRAYGPGLPRRAAGRDINTGAAMLDMDQLIVDRFGLPTCVLTTYETLRDYQQSFAAINFGIVVLDEAQRVKNPASLTWHAVSAMHSDFWLALTGTPVENRLADLWAIADVVEPGFLGSLRSFSKKYEAQFDEAALRDLKGSLEHSGNGAPFMLRRLKEHVLEGIPAKHEHLHPLPMPPVQASAYAEVVDSAHDLTAPQQMLAIVQRLRETSLHPLKPSECSPAEYVRSSARFQSLFAILDEVHSASEKALVFLDRNIIEAYLARLVQQRYRLSALPPIINGTVPGPKRQLLVDNFQRETGFGVMILSPKAGGVGLTLTAANHVIHLSRWWNPAVEDQSTDRVYRIGQRKTVHVHYLQAILPTLPGESFDERLHDLLKKKRALSRDLLWPFESESGDAATLLGRSSP
jgi:hypothetical protein